MAANPFISQVVDGNSTNKLITVNFPGSYSSALILTVYYTDGSSSAMNNLQQSAPNQFIAINDTFYEFMDVSDAYYYNQEFPATGKTIIGVRLSSGGQELDLIGSTTGTAPLVAGGAPYALVRNNYFDGADGQYLPSNWSQKPVDYKVDYTYQPVADHTGFAILSASYDGGEIEVSFNKQVDTSKLPPASFFSITANALPVTVSNVAAHATDNTKLVLTLSAAPPAGAAVNMSYTDQSAFDDAVGAQDMQGRDAASFSAQVASAGSTATITGVTVPADGVYNAGIALDFTVEFSEAITVDTTGGTPALAITLDTGGTAYASYLSGSGGSMLTFRYTVASGQADSNGISLGTSIELQGGTLKDAAGLAVGATNYTPPSTAGVLVDAVAPAATAVTSSTASGSYKAGTDIAITLAFSEAVIVTGTPTLALNNGQYANYTQGSGTSALTFVYTTQAGDDTAHLDYASAQALQLAGGTLRDAAGSDATLTLPAPGASGSLAANAQIAVDTTAPTATVTMASTTLKAGQTSTVTIAFSEAVTGFSNQNLSVSGGNLSAVDSSDGGKTWTATFTPSADLTQAANAIVLDKAGVVDAAGNTASGTTPSANYSIDTLRPTATSVVVAESSLKAGQTSLVTITFSEAVTGFSSANLTVEEGSLSQVQSTDGGLTWTATLTPAQNQNSTGNVITLSPIGVQDAAGNSATDITASNAYAVHTVRPTAAITVADSALKFGQTSQVTIVFSEAVNDFTLDDLSVAGGSLSPLQSSDGGITWTATLTPAANLSNTGNAITLDNAGVQNAAGNAGSGSTESNAYAIDTLLPTASIVVANATLKAGQTSLVTITFSEAVSGFTNAGLTVEGGSLSPVLSSDGGTIWTATFTPASGTEQSSHAITLDNTSVLDAAGNAGSGTTRSNAYAIDTQAPTINASTPLDDATNVNPGANLTLTFSENVAAAVGLVQLRKTSDNTLVEQFDVATGEGSLHGTLSIQGATLTLNPHEALAYNTDYYLLADSGLVEDSAGNYFEGISGPTTLNFKTGSAPSGGEGSPVPPATMVDGVSVTIQPGPGGTTLVNIPVVAPDRDDTPGTLSPLADIPLVKAADGHTVIGVSVPVGLGLQAESITTTGTAQLTELVYRIERIAGNADQALVRSGEAFAADLASTEPLTVQVLQPTPGTGFNPAVPLVVTGSTSAGDGKQAIVLDARALPSGTVIQVDNIDFIAVVGSVRLVGGAGQNMASGDGSAQYIVLGADDDIIHGGGGNDTVGSKGGDDQVFGDAGNDTVFGGAGNDQLSGGAGSDRLNGGTGFDVAIQEGKRTDYTVVLDGAGIKLTHVASGVSDWLVDVEQLRFETGPSLTVAHSAAEEAAAFLFQQWMGRDLTQSEGAVIQTLDGLSAVQVAELFAQVFPQQAGGRTAQQLLEGMADAGAIRVDAARATTFTGDAGDNSFSPSPGLAWSIDGGAGIDTIVFPATLAQMHVEASDKGYTLQRMTDGAMLELTNVERLTFSDTKLALDLDGHAGQAAKLIGAVAGAAFLDNKPLLGEVMRALDAGVSAQSLAQLGLQLLGANTPGQVTQLLWTNVVGSAATPAQLQPFVNMMAQGVTGGELAVLASNLELNAVRIDLVGLAATGIEFA